MKYQYHLATFNDVTQFNEGVNKLAQQGWELVNGNYYGTVFCAFMRRLISK